MVFIGFLAIFSDMGTSAALIHVEKPSPKLLSSIFYFNLFIGLILAISLVLSSSYIAEYFKDAELQSLLQLTSLNFIIISFGIVQKTLLQKDIEFKYLSLINSFALFSGLIIGLILAYNNFGTYSLVVQMLITSLLGTVLIWYYTSWRPQWYFSIHEIKKIWKYTSNLSLFNIINYFSKNADNFLIGKYLSMSLLGVYSIAYKIMLYPIQNISNILIHVLFPAFSKLQDDNKKFKKAYKQVIFYISLVTFPIMTGLMAIDNVLIPILFEDKWKGLSTLLFILAPVGMLRSIYSTVGIIYMSKGSTDIQLRVGIVYAFLTILGFVLGLKYGINGVAASYLIVNIIMFYPVLYIPWKQIGLSLKDGLRIIAPVFIISILMGLSVYGFDTLFLHHITNQYLRLVLMIVVGIISYIFMLRVQYGNLSILIKELRK